MIKRDYKRERELQLKRGEAKGNAERTKIRRAAIKAGMVKRGDGTDLDHKRPISKGGANTLGNIRVTTPSKNRGFKRNKDGSMK
jgi:hypothetical protein